ncbi:MAG: LacI family DNA-binding transcriptional regulator, partial [Tabrizicola sp.]
MRRATISDVAARAGVSTATVDRVLNGRAGVTAANRQRVQAAAKALGYLPTDDLVTLPSRPAHLEFFLPLGRSEFMHNLAGTIRDFAANLPLVASCTIHAVDGLSPAAMVAA